MAGALMGLDPNTPGGFIRTCPVGARRALMSWQRGVEPPPVIRDYLLDKGIIRRSKQGLSLTPFGEKVKSNLLNKLEGRS